MIAAQGILTSRGGKTSHAAVVARGMGKTCVCGAEELDVDTKAREVHRPRTASVVNEGDVISIDGTTGEVYLGEVPVEPSRSCVLRGRDRRADRRRRRPGRAVHRIHDPRRRRGAPARRAANADTPEDAARARRFGAQGIGLCRTEHMFLGDRAAGRAADPRRRRRRARGGAGRAAAAAARGLRRDLRGDGRAAGDDPAARPAAARVPARPHRAVGQGRRRRGARRVDRTTRDDAAAARRGPPAARAEPDARPARRAARPGRPRACSRCRCGRSPRRRPRARRRPAATRGRRS
jgi:hypothetical protein